METKKEESLSKEDIFRTVLIIVVVVLTIIGTFLMVYFKYKKTINVDITPEVNQYTEITYNSLYKYEKIDNKINFYNSENKLSATYICTSSCDVENLEGNDYLYNSNELVMLKDNNKYILYNVAYQTTKYIFDNKPSKLENNNYSIIIENNLYGIIDKDCNLIYDVIYDKIIYVNNYFILYKDNILEIYSNELIKLNIDNIMINQEDTFNVIVKDNIINISVSSDGIIKNVYNFDTTTNKLITY